MGRFVRFQTDLRLPHNGCRLGLFRSIGRLQATCTLPGYVDELLDESLDWFNRNLRVPRLKLHERRAIFWFRDEAAECIERIWILVTLLNEEGCHIHLSTTMRPGHIVYRDEHQVAAIPGKR
jgi:hypothetical protein